MMVFNPMNAENPRSTLENCTHLASESQSNRQCGKKSQTAVVGVTEFAYYLARTEFLPTIATSRRMEKALSPCGQIPVIKPPLTHSNSFATPSKRIWMMQLFTKSSTGFQDRQ
jgi:hypothetical protein